MRKVIIIDDNPNRKKPFQNESKSQLEILMSKGLLTTSNGKDLDFQSFELLEDFDLIAIHRTYLLKRRIINDLIDYIKNRDKWLILFSGGTTQNTILMNGKQLNINFSDFYNDRLIPFLDNFCNGSTMSSPLLLFLYGDSWRLTLLLQYRYLMWEYENARNIKWQFDRKREREIRNVLWADGNSRSIEEISEEITVEKNKYQNR